METTTTTAAAVAAPAPTHTHIVSKPDRRWGSRFANRPTKRHAATQTGGTAYGKRYTTVCGEVVTIDPEYNPEDAVEPNETNDVPGDPAGTGWVSCADCRKRLGLAARKF
jgi:hypothetical protein